MRAVPKRAGAGRQSKGTVAMRQYGDRAGPTQVGWCGQADTGADSCGDAAAGWCGRADTGGGSCGNAAAGWYGRGDMGGGKGLLLSANH
jgi:hypothetical protein